jgi:hypothetical protein
VADQPPSVVDAELVSSRDLVLLADPEQLELLRDETGSPGAASIELERRGRRGRPPGALNRRNAKFRDQILALYPHPAEALARAYSTPVETLAAQLGCTKKEAAEIGLRAAAELLPYLEGKAPISVDLRRRNDVVLIMPGAGTSEEELEAIRAAVDDAEEIDWSTAEAGDVLELTSFSGGPQSDVSSPSSDQSES